MLGALDSGTEETKGPLAKCRSRFSTGILFARKAIIAIMAYTLGTTMPPTLFFSAYSTAGRALPHICPSDHSSS